MLKNIVKAYRKKYFYTIILFYLYFGLNFYYLYI